MTKHWLLSNLGDTLTTILGFYLGHSELNPFLAVFGYTGIFIWKWSIVLFLLLLFYKYKNNRVGRILGKVIPIVSILAYAAIIWNIFIIIGGVG